MSSIKDIEKLKEKIKNSSTEKEQISQEAFLKAQLNIGAMCINNPEDAFLYYSSLNLLNTYVKQNKDASYSFKGEVTTAFDSIIMSRIPGVTYSYDSKERVLIVNVKGMQFSFHNVKPSPKMLFARSYEKHIGQQYHKEEEWDQLRLQPVAETVFNYANNLDGLSNESIGGDLKQLQSEFIKNKFKVKTESVKEN
ncbi:MAG: hypothetical protein E7376_02725 [Clostridiales bacterium]|nr:hypothetical protein [Clostridiales bacterium]